MNIQQFTEYYNKKMKRNLTKTQRIETIKNHFERKLNTPLVITNERECLSYILRYINEHPLEAESTLEELYYILEYSFSSLNPYYLYVFETSASQDEFIEQINELLDGSIEYGDFTFKLLTTSFDDINRIIKYEVEFFELSINDISGELTTKTSGIIHIIFDFNNKKFITSNTQISKCHNQIYQYFKDEVGLLISPIYILKRTSKMKTRNDTEFSETTLLIINLLFETIPQMGYDLTLEQINFSNLDSENIQEMRLKGTNLLRSFEVLQRIHSGDQVHNLKISLDKVVEIEGTSTYFDTTFILDLQGKLCFIFNNEEVMVNHRTLELCYKIQESLMNLLYEPSTITNSELIIHQNLPLPLSREQIISQIYRDLSVLITNSSDKINLEKYFIENYPLAYLSNN